jgi:hypothetical protein
MCSQPRNSDVVHSFKKRSLTNKFMSLRNKIALTISGIICLIFFSCSKGKATGIPEAPPATPATAIAVPLAGNGYLTSRVAGGSEKITDKGLVGWSGEGSVTSTYFRAGQKGELFVAVKAKVQSGSSVIKVSVNGTPFTLKLSGGDFKTYYAGKVDIAHAGYVKVDLQGVSRTGSYFAEVSDIMIGGPATTQDLLFANDPENFYWSRRGPSCHLSYTIPAADKEYFYSELTVPPGEDKLGTYFMANGFGEGYMGIQVNSETERRILFSVWDPEGGQTSLVRKGENVTAGRFGGEGTGGQSYMRFDWKAGTTYKFLTHGKPDGTGNTVYTSWFFAPEVGNWMLIATFTRPKTDKYLTNFHGFLENFIPEQGYQSRKAHWSNQWVRLASGNWSEVTEFKFTVDATARNKQRLDYAGGMEGGKFFLKMDGFFDNNVLPNTLFTKPATGKQPEVDLTALPQL